MDARLQIRCSTTELHRLSGLRKTPKDYRATPVATPDITGGRASTKPDGERKRTRRQEAQDAHRRLIADYVRRNPGTETRLFERTVRSIAQRCEWFGADFGGTRAETIESAFPLGFLPDAFRVDWQAKELTLVEAEITSRITGVKWHRISQLYWNLREDDWDVWVHTIDPRGIVFSIDTPLVALQLSEDYPAEEIAKSPPGVVVWQPGDGERPVTSHYWHDAVQRRLGAQWGDAR